jgi:hypothetical protein
LLSELDSPNAPGSTAAANSSATGSPSSTQQQAIITALAGAFSQNQQNLLSLLV